MLQLLASIPVFLLVFFRIGGMMIYAPLFGSARVPRRVRVLLALVLAMGMTPGVARPPVLPATPWETALAIGGELAFGLAMGMVLTLVFVACQWAGQMIGQQMGFNLGEVLDPAFGQQASLIGDLYFMLTLFVFLAVGGHRLMIQAVNGSFKALPLLSLGINQPLLDMLSGLLQTTAILAMKLAAPMLVTMLVTDLALGLIGKTVPQMNVMAAGLSLKSGIGLAVVIVGLTLTTSVMRQSIYDSMQTVWNSWTTPANAPAGG